MKQEGLSPRDEGGDRRGRRDRGNRRDRRGRRDRAATAAAAVTRARATAAATGALAVLMAVGGCSSTAAPPGQPAVSVTKPTDAARVTGYANAAKTATGSPTGPVSVVVQGATAARLRQLALGLPKSGPLICAENSELYQIVFTRVAGAAGGLTVVGYLCGSLVQLTGAGENGARTDQHCALLSAVRHVLPPSAKSVERLPECPG